MHQAESHLSETAAAKLWRKVSGPQSSSSHLLLQRGGGALERRGVKVECLERDDLLAHETAHPLELFLELRLSREVPGHVVSSGSSCVHFAQGVACRLTEPDTLDGASTR